VQKIAVTESVLNRGVYRVPYLVDGAEVLIAVDSCGVARKHVKLRAGVTEERATDWLRNLLDRIDPLPQLRLVRDDQPSRKFDLRNALDTLTEERMKRDPRFRARVNRYLAQLAGTPIAHI
jgi:hypothetical protein